MLTKILLAGSGGQGIQLIADVLSQVAFSAGIEVTQIPNYGLEQRGGASISFVIISDTAISYPRFSKPDILVIMSELARERTKKYQTPSAEIIDYKNFADELQNNSIKTQSLNIFILGILAKILEKKKICFSADIFKMIEKRLSAKPNWEENIKAFGIGLNFSL